MMVQFIMPIPLITRIPVLSRFFVTCSYLSLLLHFSIAVFKRRQRGETEREIFFVSFKRERETKKKEAKKKKKGGKGEKFRVGAKPHH